MPTSRAVALRSVAAGVLLGLADFLWIRFLPSAVGGLGNSPAVWAVAAFGLGRWVRAGRGRAAVAGAAALVVAVPAYYLTATVVQHDDARVIWQPTGLVWMCFGVVAGAVFGAAGAWSRAQGWRSTVGAALPGAVLWGEAGILLYRGRSGDPWTAALEAALGAAVVLLAGRTARHRLMALAVAVPLAVLGFLAYRAVGLGGLR